jgi:TldD protein
MSNVVTLLPDLRDRMEEALKAGEEATEVEIRLEEIENTQITFQKDSLETLDKGVTAGGCVRALVNGSWGFTSFNSVENLPARVEQAISMAKALGPGTTKLQKQEPGIESLPIEIKRDPRGVPVTETVELIRKYNDIVLKSEGIVSTISRYMHFHYKRAFANKSGSFIEQEKMRSTIVLSGMARDPDGRMQEAREFKNSLVDYDELFGMEVLAETVAKRAVEVANAPNVKAGTYPVIVDPELTGVFIHEAFGHLSEADFVYENPEWQKILTLGRKMGRPNLNVTDGGTVPDEGGTIKYDDEGTPAGLTYLIRDGILEARLHSRETAAALNEKVTGNARAISYRHAPIVRMTNTAIEPGDSTFEEMIADIEYGIYAISSHGGQTQLEQFTFGADQGFEIVNGKVGQRLRNVSISGNLFKTLENIDMISNDLKWLSIGGCGKGMQAPLPVGTGGPHIRIQDCVVGGDS